MADTFAIRLLRFLPRNLISRLFGRLAAVERPRFFASWCKESFARRFDIDFGEAEHPIEFYPSLLKMFTRRLREGARPIDLDPTAIVSPVDARVGAFGRIESGRLLQAKGMDYGLAALLGSDEAAQPFSDGHFVTLYLSPRDYHRIHTPDTGRIRSTLYEPGTLWPVNPPAVRTIPALFAVNERVTTVIATDDGELAVCMVGATNVGSIRLAYEDFVSNRRGARFVAEHVPPLECFRGSELGTFELGSTVVLLIANARFRFEGLEEGAWIPMGQAIGHHH
ncbi:MAG: phosphatidylserine decarboxylase [Planctomycetes bacterium]|nr:phosphatidylserine decarboxylase [Planctomycetota bacterium]